MGQSKVVCFPGTSEEELRKWQTQQKALQLAEAQTDMVYAYVSLGWGDGREWDGFAKEGKLGCYALVGGAPGTAKYVPVGRQPGTPQEAVAAVCAEETRVIALAGEPQGRIAVFVADGDPKKALELYGKATAARDRLVAERAVAGRFFALKWLWLLLWRWRWHRLMWRDWRA